MNVNLPLKISITIANAGLRLDKWLRQKFPQANYNELQKLIRKGQIRIEGKRVQASTILEIGQEVRLPPHLFSLSSADRTTTPKQTIDPKWVQVIQQAILHEDDHVLVINKPAGLAVQGGTGTKVSLDEIVHFLPLACAADLRLTHRLDKDTSGVLILAKTARDAAWITAHFKRNEIEKTYWGLVVGNPQKPEGLIDLPLAKRPGKAGEKMDVDTLQGVGARTRYRVKQQKQGISWIEFYPQTGRTHQIRVHSAALGCPLLGDGKYGGKKAHPFAKRTRLCLHAQSVRLTFPTGETKTFVAPLPVDMSETLAWLEFR